MKIVHIAPPDDPVPPIKYGGTQLVIYDLCEEMVKMGHDVYLLGTGDSHTSAHLIPLFDTSLRESLGDGYTTLRHFYKLHGSVLAVKELQKIKPDIIINHNDWRYLIMSELVDCPVINLCHVLKQRPEDRETFKLFKDSNFVSISDNQRKEFPDLNWVKTIYHGIELSKFPVSSEKDDYFAFLGRTTPDKGLGEICQMIKKTNHKLKIGAKIDKQDATAYEYYTTQVEPYIDGKQIEYLGEIGFAEKTQMLSRAKALLLWLTWEEPFGLVVPEAYACGTPVIVNPRGSMPEIVENGKTGFLVNSIDEMQKKLDEVGTLDTRYCRAYAEKRFDRATMAKEYVELAERIVSQKI